MSKDPFETALTAIDAAFKTVPGFVEAEFMDFHDDGDDDQGTAFFYVWVTVPAPREDEEV